MELQYTMWLTLVGLGTIGAGCLAFAIYILARTIDGLLLAAYILDRLFSGIQDEDEEGEEWKRNGTMSDGE